MARRSPTHRSTRGSNQHISKHHCRSGRPLPDFLPAPCLHACSGSRLLSATRITSSCELAERQKRQKNAAPCNKHHQPTSHVSLTHLYLVTLRYGHFPSPAPSMSHRGIFNKPPFLSTASLHVLSPAPPSFRGLYGVIRVNCSERERERERERESNTVNLTVLKREAQTEHLCLRQPDRRTCPARGHGDDS